MAKGKPAITGLHSQGIVDDAAKLLFKTAAKKARKKGVKAYDKMSKMTPATPEKKFNKQYSKFQKSNAKADRMREKGLRTSQLARRS
jgi:hypothetical protein